MVADSIARGHLKSEDEHRHDICLACRWIHGRHFVAATDGNISIRLDPSRVLTTPTAISKGMMSPDDLVITDLQGNLVAGRRPPSTELGMHLLIYQRRPDVNAVCHAHPPVATGYAAARLPLNKAIICEVVLALGCIPVAPYATPGSPELSEVMDPLVHGHDAILMANHGVVTYGQDLLTAFFRMETVEHFAHVSLVSELLGKQNLLSSTEVERLLAVRARYGTSAASQVGPACPQTSDSEPAPQISITREQLEDLIEEAVRKDRALR
jgi:L-fuculose-phosphate aldolase